MKFLLTKAFLLGTLLVLMSQGNLYGQESIKKMVRGTVTDEQNQLLTGATVLVKGTDVGTITDMDGKFEIAAAADDVLVVSFVGYASKEVTPGSQTELNIQLALDQTALDEVVVVAYGVQKRSDVTGAIGSAGAEDFNKGVVINPGQLLQGKVAGVNVSNVSGEPGAAQNVIIRGIGSLRSGTTPLYVVDGFVLDNAALNFINPQDIQTIDVLKDASAAAIYGARAANGVIVITTKRGKAGQTQVNVSASTAYSGLANKIDVFSADEFRKQVVAAGGTLDDKGGNTDWQDELTRVANSSDLNFSMSGAASERFSYFISAALQNQEGIFNNSGIKRYSGRVNLTQQALGGRLKIDYNFTGARTENDRPNIGSTVVDMLQLNPTIPAYTNGMPTLLDERLNPITRDAIFSSTAYNNRLLGNISPSVELLRGLTYKLNLGLDYSTSEGTSQTRPYDLLEGLEFGSLGTFTDVNENQLVENTLTYNLDKAAHSLTVLAGHSYQKTLARGRSFNLSGFVNNDILPVYQDQTSTQDRPTTYSSFAVENELQSFFGRLNYSFDGKYLLTATMRADGSSKFGANNKYGYFPSFAAGWNISREAFMSGSAFDNLKLRASWGKTGNQEIPSKITQASFTDSRSNNNTYPLNPGATTLDGYPYGTIFTRLANPNIQWEVSTQTDLGLDFALWGYRLTGTLDLFSKVSENILLEVVPADPIQPTATYWTNVPDMEIQNNGVELTLEYSSDPAKAFQYSIGGNISFIDNEVVNSPFAVLTTGGASGAGQTGATINGYINGEPIGAFYMKEFAGIGENGLNRFVDQNGDGQILENDRIVVGTALPNTLFGINLNAKYKGFDFGINFNGVAGNKIYNHTAMSLFQKGSLASNFNTTAFAAAYPDEDITNSNEVSTRYIENGGFLRLNNATLAYNLSGQKIGLGNAVQNIRLSVTGQNLWILTDYTGFDPEVNTNSSLGGIQSFGIDRFMYPSAQTVLFGLNVTF